MVLRHGGGVRGKKPLDAIKSSGWPVVDCRPLKNDAEKTAFVVSEFKAGDRPEEAHHIRGTLAFPQLDYVATLRTRRKLEPNRDHGLEVLADSWYHVLCDEG